MKQITIVNESSPFVRLDRLKRGDIILTHGSDKKSSAIAYFSDGEYSHASLCINSYMLFESDGYMVGNKLIMARWRANIGDQSVLIGQLPGFPVKCLVLRHPDMVNLNKELFDSALSEEREDSYGKYYSRKYRLFALATVLPCVLRTLIECLLRRWELWRDPKAITGPFCSELIASFYARLRLSLFDSTKPPDRVSPDDLAHSKLKRVEDVIIESNETLQPIERPSDFADSLYTSEVDQVALARLQQRILGQTVNEFAAQVDGIMQFTKGTIIALKSSFIQHLKQLANHVMLCALFEKPLPIQRARRLQSKADSIAPQISNLSTSDLNNSDKIYHLLRQYESFNRSHLRCSLLLASAAIKMNTNLDQGIFRSFRRVINMRARKSLNIRVRENINSLNLSTHK